ncbi:MAG: hypothetical protein HYY16_12645 [Planctomycetes bacterium]|nr:hypothetical protein [Planctomycetota bacterium]
MRSSLALVLLCLGSAHVDAQDIFERARQRDRDFATTDTYRGRDRLDLQVAADLRSASLVPDSGSGRVGVGATLDFDFACGKFDVKATLRSLFSRNMREEFLGSVMGWVESELTRNALVLACEVSPTICQALQHYRVTANAMLGMQYDRCQAIQQAVDSSLQKQQAEAINACVEEKRRAGMSMDRALEECNSPDKVRSLTGERVLEVELVEELRKALGLSNREQADVDRLLGNRVKYSAQGGSGAIAKDAVEKEYIRIRERYDKAWRDAVAAVERGATLNDAQIADLTPPGSPQVTVAEMAELTLLSPSARGVLIASVASQCALLELVRRVHEVERNIEAARKIPTADEAMIRRLERERDDLRAEVRRLRETYERQNELNKSLLQMASVGRRNIATKTAAAVSQLGATEQKREFSQTTQRWGEGSVLAGNSTQGNAPPGSGCGNCDPTSWGFGSVGGRR